MGRFEDRPPLRGPCADMPEGAVSEPVGSTAPKPAIYSILMAMGWVSAIAGVGAIGFALIAPIVELELVIPGAAAIVSGAVLGGLAMIIALLHEIARSVSKR